MPAYLLLILAVLSRLLPHAGWYNFTAVGGALLYFGARRSWREMLAPFAVLVATDYALTVFAYHYSFAWTTYIPTFAWYAAAMVLGRVLLSERLSAVRFGAAVVLGPTTFFLMSNFAVWLGSTMYPQTPGGLMESYAAGLPFYGRDVVSTALVAGLAFGVPVVLRRLQPAAPVEATVRAVR